jgi:hypothetical protein
MITSAALAVNAKPPAMIIPSSFDRNIGSPFGFAGFIRARRHPKDPGAPEVKLRGENGRLRNKKRAMENSHAFHAVASLDRPATKLLLFLIASDLRPSPSRRCDAPNDALPNEHADAADAPSVPVPTRKRFHPSDGIQ